MVAVAGPPRQQDLPRPLSRASRPARKPVPGASHGEACASGPCPTKKNEKKGQGAEGLGYSGKLSSSQRSQGVSREGLTLGKPPAAMPSPIPGHECLVQT